MLCHGVVLLLNCDVKGHLSLPLIFFLTFLCQTELRAVLHKSSDNGIMSQLSGEDKRCAWFDLVSGLTETGATHLEHKQAIEMSDQYEVVQEAVAVVV